jgi:hypothetical protein
MASVWEGNSQTVFEKIITSISSKTLYPKRVLDRKVETVADLTKPTDVEVNAAALKAENFQLHLKPVESAPSLCKQWDSCSGGRCILNRGYVRLDERKS